MSTSVEETLERAWGIPAAITEAILARRFALAACDARAIAKRFLAFPPDMAGFLTAARSGFGEIRRGGEDSGEIRFATIDPEEVTASAPAPGDWYLMRGIADDEEGAHRYRDFCEALGKGNQSDVTAFAHGEGVHAPRHTDLAGGLVVMLEGRREWRVEPPLARGDGMFSPPKCGRWGEGFSPSIPVVETRADTALYVPAGWWHETRSLTPSLILRVGIAERTVAGSRRQAQR